MLAPFFLAVVLAAPPAAPTASPPATPAANTTPAAGKEKEPKLDLAIERAAREYRIQVYESFRQTREEFDARRALGTELLKAWNRAEQPARHREAVLEWFAEAKRQSQQGEELTPYADLEDLKSLIVVDKLPDAADATATTDDKSIKLPPPFIVEPAQTGSDSSDAALKIFNRVETLFSGQNKTEPAAPPAN